jgi:ribonuclease III
MAVLDPRRHKELHRLIAKLGLADTAQVHWQLVDLALTHPTFSSVANYEQLEFIGDAVLRLAAAEFLFETDARAAVGELSALRAVLVSDRSLTEIARQYGLNRYLQVGGSAINDPRGEASRLAEALEALLGALYLSTHDLSLIRPWLDRHMQQQAAAVRADPARQNYKAALQSWTQARYRSLPEYRVEETGPIHDPERFTAEVWFQGQRIGRGQGPSKQAAEKQAAQAAFLQLQANAVAPAAES